MPGRFPIVLLVAALAAPAAVSPAVAHEWYGGLRSPLNGASCCSSRDCQPVRTRYGPSGMEIEANGGWWPAPPEAMLDRAAPDNGTHACWPNRRPGEVPLFLCVIVGGSV